jgi:hypothetical protein
MFPYFYKIGRAFYTLDPECPIQRPIYLRLIPSPWCHWKEGGVYWKEVRLLGACIFNGILGLWTLVSAPPPFSLSLPSSLPLSFLASWLS